MENETLGRRRLIIILVVTSVVVFVGLVGLIISRLPLNGLGRQSSTPTSAELISQDCTHPIGYWRVHPELYPPQIIIGGTAYQERELEALLADDSQETTQQLKAQLAVAFLNGQAGADQSAIEPAIFEGYDWLVQHPTGSPVSEAELQKGQQLVGLLEAYNQGLDDAPPCEAILAVTRTSTPTTSVRASQTDTATASATPTASTTYILPSATARSTYEPPAQSATDTEAPPTQEPAPTDTQRPADTPTFTSPPPPTATFTLPPLPTTIFTLPPPPPG